MKIEITGKNYSVSEHLKEVIDKKLSKLDKYFGDGDTLARVVFKKESSTMTTEVSLEYCGKFVRATASGDNFYDNIDKILPKLEGQIRKHRTRFDKHGKNKAFKEDAVFDGASGIEREGDKKLVKKKKFRLVPMTEKEAIEEMELLGHSFYVYLDAKTQNVRILYVRSDGDLGIIDPEI